LKRFLVITILVLIFYPFLNAQESKTDTITGADSTVLKHSPRKAVIMSAVLPGLGQVYNQKYWKVPIIYAALGTLTYFIIDYNKKYNTYVNAYDDYLAYQKGDKTRTSFQNIRRLENFDDKTYFLKRYKDFYRRWRDLDVLILTGVYVLNIIDANIDAHFFYFEIGDDITLNVNPYIQPYRNSQNIGLSLNIKF
jgi:hypothetical protein